MERASLCGMKARASSFSCVPKSAPQAATREAVHSKEAPMPRTRRQSKAADVDTRPEVTRTVEKRFPFAAAPRKGSCLNSIGSSPASSTKLLRQDERKTVQRASRGPFKQPLTVKTSSNLVTGPSRYSFSGRGSEANVSEYIARSSSSASSTNTSTDLVLPNVYSALKCEADSQSNHSTQCSPESPRFGAVTTTKPGRHSSRSAVSSPEAPCFGFVHTTILESHISTSSPESPCFSSAVMLQPVPHTNGHVSCLPELECADSERPDTECPICFERYDDNVDTRIFLPCCHSFHEKCARPWITSKMTCPTCRHPTHVIENDFEDL